MGIFDRFSRNKKQQPQTEERAVNLGGLVFGGNSGYATDMSMKLAAVYCATNQISDSVAMLPARIYKYKNGKKVEIDHPLSRVLNLRPSSKFSHYNFFKMLIESVILKGNGYAYIERDENLNVKALHYINPDYVQPMVMEDGSIKYIVTGYTKAIDDSDMINVYLHCDTNYNGLSIIKYAALTLALASDTNGQADAFFKSGANLSGVIKSSAPLTNEQKKQIQESWNSAFNTQTGKVSVAVLPQGLDYQSISISPEDSQLLEYQKFTVIEIARFFNISPIKLFDLQEVSYSSMESTQLSYLQDTITPYVQALEDEMNYKLFRPSEVGKVSVDFDFEALLNANKESLAKYYRDLLLSGILSVDEVREKLGYTPVDSDASKAHWIQLSYAPLDRIFEGNVMEQQAQSELDNKVKDIVNNDKEKTEE